MTTERLTQEEAQKIFHYNPDTGIFTYKVSTNNRVKVGDIVGSPAHGYLTVMYQERNYRLHRLAFLMMTGKFPEGQVDHINGIRSDNRWINLREATHTENTWNRKSKGVIYIGGKYRAYAYSNGKTLYLGRYNTEEEAFHIAQEKRKELKGKFYRETSL